MKFSHIVGVVSFLSLLCVPFSCSAEVYGTSLNADESLALFGTSIPAVYYNGSGVDTAVFEYIGNTFAIKQDVLDLQEAGSLTPTYPVIDVGSSRGTIMYNSLRGLYDDQNDGFFTDDVIKATNYLIYRWSGGAGTPPSAGNFDFQVQVDSSIGINAQAMAFSLLWSCPDMLSSRSNSSSRSDLTLYDAAGYPSGEIKDVIGGCSSYWNNNYWIGTFGVQMGSLTSGSTGLSTPTLFSEGQSTFCGCFIRAGSLEDDAPGIDFNGFRANLKNVEPKLLPTAGTVTDGSLLYDEWSPWSVYLLVQCPIVFGDYILPEPEDNTSLGDINENLDNLVISTDELRKILLRIESTNNDILTVERVHTQQFINIIDLLDDIYNNMAASGEISVPDLNDAAEIPIDSAIDSRISSEFENFEFPELEDNLDQEEVSGFFGLISNFWSWIPARVIAIYSIAMVLGLVSWLLFRGRGG